MTMENKALAAALLLTAVACVVGYLRGRHAARRWRERVARGEADWMAP